MPPRQRKKRRRSSPQQLPKAPAGNQAANAEERANHEEEKQQAPASQQRQRSQPVGGAQRAQKEKCPTCGGEFLQLSRHKCRHGDEEPLEDLFDHLRDFRGAPVDADGDGNAEVEPAEPFFLRRREKPRG